MRSLIALVVAVIAMFAVPAESRAQQYGAWGYYQPTGPNSYVYHATSYWATPPYYAPYGYGYGASHWGYEMPPVGFGSPYYSGYNDPYFGLYGPGVQEFLYFGGADFYGW